ncbi:MAG: hypothetical protein Q4B69_00040 [Slackia sp.]|nr:hypothetical protein [Slackia sp.]
MIARILKYKLAKNGRGLLGVITLSVAYYAIALFRFFSDTNELFSTEIGFLDALVHFYAGNQPFNPLHDTTFTIPLEWITLQVLIAFFVGFHANDDLHAGSAPVIVRSANSQSWWAAQCIWTICIVMLVYAIGVFAAAAACLATHGSFWSFDSTRAFFGMNIMENANLPATIAALAIAPCASCALSLVQITIASIRGSFTGLLLTMLYQTVSAYSSSPLLSGDCGMVVRNIAWGGTFQTPWCLLTCITITLVIFIVGIRIMEHHDLC